MTVKLIHRLDSRGLPPADLEVRLAGLALENPLYGRLLERLGATPKRYGELKPLLAGKADNNLTNALKRLQAEGLVDQLVDPRLAKADATLYCLTHLGLQVLFTIKTIQTLQNAKREPVPTHA